MDSAEILIEILGEERRERRHQAAERQQALVQNGQRDERLLRVSAHTLAATTVQTHVAVREQVDEVHEARHHRVQTVRLHFLTNEADELLRGGLPVIHCGEQRTSSQRSITLVLDSAFSCEGRNGSPVFVSQYLMFCSRKRYALYQGMNTSFSTPWTPDSLKRSGSARTTGELMRYRRTESAPYLSMMVWGSG